MKKVRRNRGTQVPLFIQKLSDMLQDEECEDYITWTETEDGFVIKNIASFTENVLPKYFKHNNYSSFIRQLNMYGFNKIRHDEEENVYQNDYFKKGHEHLIKNIHRKVHEEKELSVSPKSSSKEQSQECKDLRVKQKDLESVCHFLVAQNQKLLSENNTLVRQMRRESREKDKKMEQLLLTLILAKNQNINQGSFGYPKQLSITGALSQLQEEPAEPVLNRAYSGLLEDLKGKTNLEKMYNFLYKNNQKEIPPNFIRSIQKQSSKETFHDSHKEEEHQNIMQNVWQDASQDQEKGIIDVNDFLSAEDRDDLFEREGN